MWFFCSPAALPVKSGMLDVPLVLLRLDAGRRLAGNQNSWQKELGCYSDLVILYSFLTLSKNIVPLYFARTCAFDAKIGDFLRD